MDVLVIDSDSETYTETTDSEDHEDSESSYGGHCQSILSNLDESIGKIDDFLAFERGFIHGDIVCSISDPSGQLGRVFDVDMVVDLESTCGKFVKNVNSKKLLRLRSFASGDYVIHGPWLGRVERVFDLVNILLNDGTQCEILMGDPDMLTPISPSFEDAPYPYYPGQHVHVNLPSLSKSTTWLCGSWKQNRNEGIICHVEAGLVYVSWIASVAVGHAVQASPPPHFQDPKNLTLFSYLAYANWQLGDWCTLPTDYFHELPDVDGKPTSPSGAPNFSAKLRNEVETNHPQMYVITKTKSRVDVLWQNGERSIGLDPKFLSPVSSIGDHDFWPEQFVLEKVTSEEMIVPRVQKLGIVKSVDAHERTVKVKWFAPNLKKNIEINGESTEEIVSAYELSEHPDFSYSIGDVVFRCIPLAANEGESQSEQNIDQTQKHYPLETTYFPFQGNSTYREQMDETENKDLHSYLSCIGNFVGYKGEGIEVRWANDLLSKVLPSEIIGLDKILYTASTPASNETLPNAGKDLVDQVKQLHKKEKEGASDISEDCMKDVLKSTSLLFSQTAINFLARITSSLFSLHNSLPFCSTVKKKEISQYHDLKMEDSEPSLSISTLENKQQHAEESKPNEESTSLSIHDKSVKFKQFDIVNDYSDHHFASGTGNEVGSSQAGQIRRGWLKKIQQEWNILKNGLPDTIYVRVFEERMDLLRASIVGASGTPYHDGLFFFDIFFPPDYPHEPPVVHYNSGGLRLNPNLYESGKVCLSLLKTWMGTGTEVWNPEKSTILQLLLSLQALVLNDKPYFNEAGYDEQIGRVAGEKNSITYNENTFIQSCKSMMYVLHRPPKHFEELVEEHFAHRSRHILRACKAYLDGAQVGQGCETSKLAGKSCGHSSTGFKIMLAKLLPKLVSAFTENGVDCSQFLDEVTTVQVT